MPEFGPKSESKLITCDPDLQDILRKAILITDFSVTSGYRGDAEQEKMVMAGVSPLHYPDSKHNCKPSRAVDIVPFPVEWPERKDSQQVYNRKWNRFHRLVGVIEGIASEMEIEIRCGIDWKKPDGPHIELV